MNLLDLIFCGVITTSIALLFIIMYRTDKVLNFRLDLIKQIYSYNVTIIDETLINPRIDYSVMGSYNKMVFMFWKPLKKEKWFSNQILNKLKNLK